MFSKAVTSFTCAAVIVSALGTGIAQAEITL